MVDEQRDSTIINPRLTVVAWEITRQCNLFCAHCRASSHSGDFPGELSKDKCFEIIDQIATVAKPILILSGGEPLLRPDVFEIGRYAYGKGLRAVMGTNGTLITPEIASQIEAVPIPRISVSLDFPNAEAQDKFRGHKGAFDAVIKGIANARAAGVEVQINSTISKLNVHHLNDLIELALKVGAVAFHPFMLVPTGRGKELAQKELSPAEYESTLKWICQKQVELGDRLMFKPTDAPHYYRIAKQCGMDVMGGHGHARAGGHPGGHPAGTQGMNAMTRGCMAGIGYCFISHVGKVQGCGYLDIEAGDLTRQTFGDVWENSRLFNELRDLSNLKGKCGRCEFKRLCGGCRARSYETTGDHLAAEPYCIYQPGNSKTA